MRQIGVTLQTFCRWRKLYGGMGSSQLARLQDLEKKNQRLRRAVSDLTLDKLILTKAATGNVWGFHVAENALTICGANLEWASIWSPLSITSPQSSTRKPLGIVQQR
jgi:hypothetical protein